MKRFIVLIAVLLAFGCTQKYVSITLEDGSNLTVHGNIDPAFMREGTTETISPSVDLKIPLNEVNCNQCHAAYAGELFSGKWKLPDIPEKPDDPVDPPDDPVEPPPPPVEKYSMHYDHINAYSVFSGPAIIFCKGEGKKGSCAFNGKPMHRHSDKGRDMWWIQSNVRSGVITCDGVSYKVSGSRNMQWGDCR